jgi:hypothetical protein
MRETTFLKRNADKWRDFEKSLKNKATKPDVLAQVFIELTDDLAYSQTNYPQTQTTIYLNHLATLAHQLIYKNKKEKGNRFIKFWQYELPLTVKSAHKPLFYSFLIFAVSMLIGAVSAAYDQDFVRVIMGDYYVNMTLENIKNGDPMAVYKGEREEEMFLSITTNNIRVSFNTFVLGILFSFGTLVMLFRNGIMLGCFQYFFYEHDLLFTSFLTIWIMVL